MGEYVKRGRLDVKVSTAQVRVRNDWTCKGSTLEVFLNLFLLFHYVDFVSERL